MALLLPVHFVLPTSLQESAIWRADALHGAHIALYLLQFAGGYTAVPG
jgi:hypothetical protein